MLSIGKLLPGRADYYLGTVATGVEDYYTGAGEAPGQWCGTSAERLGQSGQVDAEGLHRLLEHAHPATGERLTRGHAVPKVSGFDTTFCAPKSVSLLFGLGDPEVSNHVRNAHDAAVTRALEMYEAMAARGRRGAGGHHGIMGEGFVAAAFRHRTSRNLDPHLHTHVVVANLVYAEADDRWSALDGRPLYQWCRTIGHLYNAQLRHELTRRLGVEWGPVENGLADIAGIPRPVIDAFSTRRHEIETDLDEHGRTGARAAQAAVYKTRSPKADNVDTADLFARWRDQANELGFDAAAIERTLDRSPVLDVPRPGTPAADQIYQQLASPTGLTERTSTFGRRDVIEGICNALPGGGTIEDIVALADDFLVSHLVVGLGGQDDAPLYRRDGTVLPSGRDTERYSTPEMIQVEQRLLASAARRERTHAGVASGRAVSAALEQRPTITHEQATMVQTICSSGDGVDVVVGVAGAGKTFALAAAHDAWTASGFSVHGVCLAAKTARRLQDSTGIRASTLDALLLRLNRSQLEASDVIIVDEAAMVGTRKLEQLLAHAEAAGAKVVLIGDPCQLPEIDAGGAFAGLAQRLGAVELHDNRRQHEPWERAALAELRNGNPDHAIDTLLDRDRIHIAHTTDGLYDTLIDRWDDARAHGQDTLMCAPTRRHVDALNLLARVRLTETGELHGPGHWIGRHHFAVGDRVLGLRNDRQLGILNGDHATITHIDPDRHQLTLVGDTGTLRIPFAYAEQHLTHAYATTIHKAQGATVDAMLVLADDTVGREHLYTALSRGRVSNDLFMTVTDWRDEIRHAPEHHTPAIDGLRHTAHRSRAQHLAIDSNDDLVPTDVLRAEQRRLRDVLGSGPRDTTYDLRQVTAEIQQLRQRLTEATARRDEAAQRLEAMGPVGRHLHRKDRTRFEQEVARGDVVIDGTSSKIADRVALVPQLREDAGRYRAWAAETAPERQRLQEVERTLSERSPVSRLQPRRTPELDIGLGI